MENRIKNLMVPEPPSGVLPTDFYEVSALSGLFVVSYTVARAIERQLARETPPKWVVFRDLSGSRHRLLAETIRRLTESTAEQRKLDREFLRQLRKEEKEDRRLGEEDDGW